MRRALVSLVVAVSCAGFAGVSVASAAPLRGAHVATVPPAANGYQLVDAAGDVRSFGTASEGSLSGVPLTRPIVGQATTPDGFGYDLVASDGGVFSFGAAPFDGSTGSSLPPQDGPSVADEENRREFLDESVGPGEAYRNKSSIG